ncbi:DUF927 domain-containing protein [Novosphingobium subterraneum]|uniref:DUF927 domain-containing protein n=1 Tax=Novosphingobium subterraneum TaxID=48936 RepID=A0A0B9A902_9SPHN|nr:DUF927 domain-containing protein [Novosphingobium subterraneum]KHS45842.1 hypothetical protein NJ75_02447 [Novosphingobium subterraneum]
MSTQIRISGHRAASGQRYIHVETDQGSATLRLEQFSLANSRLAGDLAAAGFPVFTKKQLEEVVGEVPYVTDFQDNRVAEHPGWNGKFFVQQDGSAIGSDAAPWVMFTPKPGATRKRGTLSAWQAEVANSVKAQPLVASAIMAAFLPPVLHLMPQAVNATIEIVGPSGTGKSTALMLAASVAGPVSSIASMRDVLTDPESARRDGRDHLLIVDHVHPAVITTAKTKKADLFVSTAFDLVRAPGGRVTLLSGRWPLADACDMEPEGNILTLRANGDGLGVFSALPPDAENAPAFAAKLVSAARKNHGHALPAFVARLQADLIEDAAKVRARLAKHHDDFLRHSRVAAAGGAERQAAGIFASLYAAGCLARRYRVLPRQFLCKRLALAALDHYRRAQAAQVPFVDRLEALIASGQIVALNAGSDPALQAQAVSAALGTVVVRATSRIVRIAPESILKAFPDWSRIKGSAEVRAVLKMDGKNSAVWGKLAPGMERVRLFQFELPVHPELTLFTGTETGAGPDDRE